VGMARPSTLSRAGVSKVENLEQQAFMANGGCPEAKMACMHEQRSFCCTRSRWRGALSRYIMSLPEPVGVTYICHGPDSRPRGAPA
jgi:hypothetical protein